MGHDIAKPLAALRAHHDATKSEAVRDLFAADPQRFAHFHVAIDGLVFDYSKQRV